MTTQRATIKDLREEYKRLRAQGLLRPPRYTKQEQIAMATGGYPYETYGPIEKGARNAPMLSPRRSNGVTRDELLDQARYLGLRGYSRLRKAELEQIIQQYLVGTRIPSPRSPRR